MFIHFILRWCFSWVLLFFLPKNKKLRYLKSTISQSTIFKLRINSDIKPTRNLSFWSAIVIGWECNLTQCTVPNRSTIQYSSILSFVPFTPFKWNWLQVSASNWISFQFLRYYKAISSENIHSSIVYLPFWMSQFIIMYNCFNTNIVQVKHEVQATHSF